jgi:DNA-binding XRE family transcriptional regulator
MENLKISLEAARVNAKKTQEEVAQYLGIHRDTYRKYERGELAFRMDMAVKFSEYVNLPLENINFSLPQNIA